MNNLVTVVIPTYNEEVNIKNALQSAVGWAKQVIVVDSGSTDNTAEIAKSYGAEVIVHPYENMAAQRMWGVMLPSIQCDWILNLDADEYITDELKSEIDQVLEVAASDVGGFLIRRKHYFLGKWMKHGGDYIWLLRLVRRGHCRVIKTPIINEHTIVSGKVNKLQHDFVHHPRKDLTEWMQRVNTGARKFALTLHDEGITPQMPDLKPEESVEGALRTTLNYRVYSKIPLWMRPFARFFVFYIVRCGFLDGWQGFVYHVINDFFYPFLVWAKCKEFENNKQSKLLADNAKWR